VDVLDQLAALPTITTVAERAAPAPGTRLFVLGFQQPVDHCATSGAGFTQRATLVYRGRDLPTILATTGYGISLSGGQTELTVALGANQVLLEHRFFDVSTPAPVDWTRLDIFQAATDEHRVVETLRPLLRGPWVTTGASKGGMTAVFHRAFYPADVEATVAYVAPISFSRADPRYATWLESIGPAACRDALHAAQVAILQQRADVAPLMADAALAAGDGYTALGLQTALDFAALELPFAFWQYGSEAACPNVPAAGASAAELFAFMEATFGGTIYWWGDSTLDYYAAYYYQSATQLGGPAYPQGHLLAAHGGVGIDDLPEVYPPAGVVKTWDGTAMPAVDAWVRLHGDRIMFVYGERDPWSGGQFTPSPGGEKLLVPLANHGARISMLPAAERDATFGRIRAWLGLPRTPMVAARLAAEQDGGQVDERLLLPRWRPGR
jgi:hypothetical protein